LSLLNYIFQIKNIFEENYKHNKMDEEIQQLMEELILRRTQEKDYKSLED